jgi:hypothetical protein
MRISLRRDMFSHPEFALLEQVSVECKGIRFTTETQRARKGAQRKTTEDFKSQI